MLSALLMTLSCTVSKTPNTNFEKEVKKATATIVDNLVDYIMEKDID